MESSRLQTLVDNILEPIKADPEAFIKAQLSPQGEKIYLGLKGLLALPFAPVKIDPVNMINSLIQAIQNWPACNWSELELILRDYFNGDDSALIRVKNLFGVVVDGSNITE